MDTKAYIEQVLENVKKRNSSEPEFIQAVEEVLHSLGPVLENHPEYIKANILERFCEPERQIMFKVPWTDDNGDVHVNRGFRVQFNGVIGPYKGGLRFHPSVYLGIIKFLGFEQILKNSLTGLPIGGGKGGSDFDPRGRSDAEIRRFCESYMTELYRHIGPDVDVPAGDIGVGAREVGYMYGHYRRIRGAFENGVFTGKGLSYGGSLFRPEATGFGVAYFCEEILKHEGTDFKGKTVALSGFGQVSWGACKKIAQLGGKVVTISGPDGYIYDPNGIITEEKISYLLEMRNSGRDKVKDYADKFGVEFFPGQKPWGVKVDIIMPCATQNDIHLEHAKQIVANGIKFVCEGANMPCTNEAVQYFLDNGLIVGPAKAANAGGVATSALEMSQNSMRLSWTGEEVDAKLRQIMTNIHNNAMKAAETYGFGYNLVAGANIAGFVKVAEAMHAQGVY
ncbi:NAD-specific glutamate dehydrogenase [Clostridium argentinense CDC 2741]|uniref:Glutamate dehydrogenase n=1 Tax=Clostridium argentinense CDC 2741 TaxID=1418104 RepID=A0A0C1R3Q9_9CLOT|nr:MULTISPECIES: NADP-specific glutamate dehydrogenase [Clostridium]ARC85190.1 glutamate dehydrogenase [Clostridium argentinense]KIE48187.1 NAD-specific glutamate dehydrogenase [Clostridium argentinense CDC 2741]NFF39507.1 NADP-specific glutamate dehydrogenase [Clostridium argentinense]NFP50946.1 NADP-specific glutamate dehydrogenase [Clostridium argentinense]NFP73660.1 NADP-specific glutamate dehydrogenase [Clostridium argentinense]